MYLSTVECSVSVTSVDIIAARTYPSARAHLATGTEDDALNTDRSEGNAPIARSATKSDKAPAPVSVLGLGAMGQALAAAFVEHGHPTTVWNRSPGKADDLVARGARCAADVADAVSASELTVICVVDYDAVHEVLASANDAVLGRVLINLTTGIPEQAREMSLWASQHGAEYVDGGIMAVPSMIAKPEGLVLYSGSQDAFERHAEVLETLGTARYVGPEPGRAALIDFALLSGMYGMLGGFVHAVALAGSEGISATEFTSAFLVPWLQAMVNTLPEQAHQIDAKDYAAKEASLSMQTSGVGIVAFSRRQGVSPELLAPVQALMERRVADGHGGDDFASVIELIRSAPVKG